VSQAQLQVWPARYEMIDGLRGLAALVVVMNHLKIVTFGHYAVMVFFVISGYCIAASAEAGRRTGMGFGQYMRRRLHRIYPPYFFAIVFFVATRVVKLLASGENDLHRPWLDWVLNLTMTQWLALLFHPVADAPQNPHLLVSAFWSLNYEDQFYLVMAGALAVAVKFRVPIWTWVAGLAVAGLAWNRAVPEGWITGFFLEYWLDFSLGALLFYVLCAYPGRSVRIIFPAAVFALGIYSAAQLDLRAYAELTVACAFTLGLYFVRPVSAFVSRTWLWRPIAALGAISYSLYLINQFNLTLVAVLADHLAPNAWGSLRSSLMLVLQIGVATVFWYCCERPFLNRSSRAATPESARLPLAPNLEPRTSS
jgi:peptidoglycan/LPS O-acetylase OafA/YrhL